MPITALDPNTALVVIDLQKGIVAIPTTPPVGEVVQRAVALVEAFRRHGLLVALVNVDDRPPGRTEQGFSLQGLPADWAELIPELNRQSQDIVVTKKTTGAFTSTDLDAQLKARGVTQLVIVGVATGSGVEATARHAFELGYNVTLAVDAMADRSAETHAHSLTRVFPRIGETGAAEDVIALLDQRVAA